MFFLSRESDGGVQQCRVGGGRRIDRVLVNPTLSNPR